jgi:hypothetical protein
MILSGKYKLNGGLRFMRLDGKVKEGVFVVSLSFGKEDEWG